jgi:hypothetical protein
VIVHRFGSLDAKQEQRYYAGIGPRKFQFKRPNLGWTEANQLKTFWAACYPHKSKGGFALDQAFAECPNTPLNSGDNHIRAAGGMLAERLARSKGTQRCGIAAR